MSTSRRGFFGGLFGAAAASIFAGRSHGKSDYERRHAAADAEEAARIENNIDAQLREAYRRKLQGTPCTRRLIGGNDGSNDAQRVIKLCEEFEGFGVHQAFWNEPRWHPFELVHLPPDVLPEFPLDFLPPDTDRPYCSYIMPNCGRLPERCIGGDFIHVPTYDIGAAADWLIKLTRDKETTDEALGGYVQILQNKMFYDQWHTLLAAGSENKFTTKHNGIGRIIDEAQKQRIARHGKPFTDVVIGSWCFDKMFSKDYAGADTWITCIKPGLTVQCVVHKLEELNYGWELYNFYHNHLLDGEDAYDLAVFVDNHKNDSCVTVIREDLTTWFDPTLIKQRRYGIYGWLEVGHVVLDNRIVQVGEYYAT